MDLDSHSRTGRRGQGYAVERSVFGARTLIFGQTIDEAQEELKL